MAGIHFVPSKSWMVTVRNDDGESVDVPFEMLQKFVFEQTEITKKLSDPDAVHFNMLGGNIAKISMSQCAHTHGDDMVERWNAFTSSTGT